MCIKTLNSTSQVFRIFVNDFDFQIVLDFVLFFLLKNKWTKKLLLSVFRVVIIRLGFFLCGGGVWRWFKRWTTPKIKTGLSCHGLFSKSVFFFSRAFNISTTKSLRFWPIHGIDAQYLMNANKNKHRIIPATDLFSHLYAERLWISVRSCVPTSLLICSLAC